MCVTKEGKPRIPNPLCAVPLSRCFRGESPELPSCAQLEVLARGCSMHGLCVCELRSQQGAAQPLPVLAALLGGLTPIYLSWFFSVLNRRVHFCIPAAAVSVFVYFCC